MDNNAPPTCIALTRGLNITKPPASPINIESEFTFQRQIRYSSSKIVHNRLHYNFNQTTSQLETRSSVLIILHLLFVLVLVLTLLFLTILFQSPVLPPLTPQPANTLTPLTLSNGPGIAFVHNTRNRQRKDKHPHIPALHRLPPAALHANLPQAVDAGPRRVQEHASAVATLHPSPHAREEAPEEDTLGGKNMAGEILLEKAKRCPCRGDGTGSKGGEAQHLGYHPLNGGEGEVVQVAELGHNGQGGVKDEEEASHCWEGIEPKGQVCS